MRLVLIVLCLMSFCPAFSYAGEPWIAASDIAVINANPAAITSVWNRKKDAFKQRLASHGWEGASDADAGAAFASMAAYLMKPYGQSRVLDLESLMKEQQIDCDNYAALTWHFFTLLYTKPNDMRFVFVGWNGRPFGNHA